MLNGSGFVTKLSTVGHLVGKQSNSKTDEFDIIIIGGGACRIGRTVLRSADISLGTAGCVLASRLTEDPSLRVLVLESGGRSVTFLHLLSLSNCVRSGRSLFFSRLPSAFPLLFHTKHVYELHTEPQTSADGKTKYWPRGASTTPPLAFLHSN
jgi:choline dehydrogenase